MGNITDIIAKTCLRLQELGGRRIIIKNDPTMLVDGLTEYWKTSNSQLNTIKYNGSLPGYEHLILHELTHLSMFISNTIANKGKTVQVPNTSVALLFSKYRDAWTRIGMKRRYSPSQMVGFVQSCCYNFTQQIVNLALDLFVEQTIYDIYPDCREIQKQSVLRMESDNIEADTSGIIRNFPPGLIRVSRIANTVRALQVRNLFEVDTVNKHLASLDDINFAQSMYDSFKTKYDSYCEGDEYTLVMQYAEDLDWGEMIYIQNE